MAQLIQFGTLSSLKKSTFVDIVCPDSETLSRNVFGLGAFSALSAEMTIADGVIYKSDERTRTAEKEDMSPFMFFVELENPQKVDSFDGFGSGWQERLPGALEFPEKPYVYVLKGKFSSVTYKTSPRGNKGYRELGLAISEQKRVTLEDCRGTVVGFWFPESWEHINSPGFHSHFLAEDARNSGHIISSELHTFHELLLENIEDVKLRP